MLSEYVTAAAPERIGEGKSPQVKLASVNLTALLVTAYWPTSRRMWTKYMNPGNARVGVFVCVWGEEQKTV